MEAKKILIIEDDTQIGNLEQELLERQDYFCLRAYSGTEAVMLLERERTEALRRLTEELFQYSVITSACDDTHSSGGKEKPAKNGGFRMWKPPFFDGAFYL